MVVLFQAEDDRKHTSSVTRFKAISDYDYHNAFFLSYYRKECHHVVGSLVESNTSCGSLNSQVVCIRDEIRVRTW